MPKKGISNNPAGRPAGTQNRVTTEIKTRIRDFLNANWQQFEEDFRKLDAKDRVTLMKDLLKFAAPIQREQDFKIDFSTLSESEISLLIDKMLDQYGK